MKHPRMTQIFLDAIWKERPAGFFVELGAWNGHKKNSTNILESKGWDGVCIEPTPESFKELIAHRNCRCLNVAVSNKIGKSLFTFFKDDPACNGLHDYHSSLHKERYALRDTEIIEIDTVVWSDLDLPMHIDYLQLDTEGSELEILQSINWDIQKISYICLEDNELYFFNNKRYTDYMTSLGYECILSQGVDLLWYKS
jgi:FkbM family methyltransferase